MPSPIPDPTEARQLVIQIATASRAGDIKLAIALTDEYAYKHGTLLPLLISSLTIIETIILSTAESVGMPADELWHGIALGLSMRQIQERKNQQ